MLVNSVCAWYSGVRSMEQETVGSPAQYIAYSNDDGTPISSAAAGAVASATRTGDGNTLRSLFDS